MQYSRERRSRFPTKIFGRLYRKANEVPINLVTMACFHIFGAFRKFRKATIRFMSVRPRGTTRLPLNDFQLIWYLSIFRKSVDQIRFIKIWQELCVLYMKTSRHLWRHRDEFFLEWEMFHTSVVWKIKTHILCSVTFSKFAPLWDNVQNTVDPDRPQMKICTWRMHCACLTNKATETHSECVIFTTNPQQQWLGERASPLLFMYVACLVSVFVILDCVSIEVRN